jgi:hypothetical protein
VAATFAVAVAVPIAATGSAATPSLHVVKLMPLVVRGAGFRAQEHVRVTAQTNPAQLKRVTATLTGGFRVTFDDVLVSRCDNFRVIAVGNLGSRVVIKRLPAPACLPASSS